tara:strand:- start:1114 stop:2172 length:1059 start_codon:yes stop_codon:yes gene_type:complete
MSKKKIPLWDNEEERSKAGLTQTEMLLQTVWDPKLVSEGVINPNVVPVDSGLYHTAGPAGKVEFQKADNETVLPRNRLKARAQIVFGSDRKSTKASGFGARGPFAYIDMVTGRMAGVRGGKGPKAGDRVGPEFAADAARIYISELTDIDTNFGIAEGAQGTVDKRSGIAVKADAVRIIGREGVKIVTGAAQGWKGFGKNGEPNSLGGKLLPAPKIELIAGNTSEAREVVGGLFNSPETYNTLQGIALGENTVECFRDLSQIIDQIWAVLDGFISAQMKINAALPGAVAATAGPGAPAAGGSLGGVVGANVIMTLIRGVSPMQQIRNNKGMWEANHLTRQGYRFIESTNVFTT